MIVESIFILYAQSPCIGIVGSLETSILGRTCQDPTRVDQGISLGRQTRVIGVDWTVLCRTLYSVQYKVDGVNGDGPVRAGISS